MQTMLKTLIIACALALPGCKESEPTGQRTGDVPFDGTADDYPQKGQVAARGDPDPEELPRKRMLPRYFGALVAIRLAKVDLESCTLDELLEFLRMTIAESEAARGQRIPIVAKDVQPLIWLHVAPDGEVIMVQGDAPGYDYFATNVTVEQVLSETARIYHIDWHITTKGIVVTPPGVDPFPNCISWDGLIFYTYRGEDGQGKATNRGCQPLPRPAVAIPPPRVDGGGIAPTWDIVKIVDGLCHLASHHQVFFAWRPFLSDPDDDLVLELAVAASAPFIITHNTTDFDGSDSMGVRAITPAAALKLIRPWPPYPSVYPIHSIARSKRSP